MPTLEAAISLPVTGPEEPDMALARGAALASANAPLFASSTAALAYALDPGTGEMSPRVLGPNLDVWADVDVGTAARAYSAIADEDEKASRRPMLLAGSALAGIAAVIAGVVLGTLTSDGPTPAVRANPPVSVATPGIQLPAPVPSNPPQAQVPAPSPPSPAPAPQTQVAAPAPVPMQRPAPHTHVNAAPPAPVHRVPTRPAPQYVPPPVEQAAPAPPPVAAPAPPPAAAVQPTRPPIMVYLRLPFVTVPIPITPPAPPPPAP
jgi:hypothetical protein